ncbi:MAG: cysteine desulfurase family protein [Promethearchaeota archaeon]
MTSDSYYFDFAATSPVDEVVVEEMCRVYRTVYGNPSSLHALGHEALKVLKKSRETVAGALNAKPEEIVFTGGGSEADNLAIKGVAFKNRGRGKHIVTSEFEHAAVLNTVEYLRAEHGFDVTVLPVDDEGLVDIGELESSLKSGTTLVSIMYANNEIGTVQDVAEIGRVCREHGVIFHTDAVQAFCKIPVDVKADNIDLLSAAAHKIYGPKGVGLLYVRGQGVHPQFGTFIEPIIHGGGQEFKLRAGTQNVPGIAGFAKAVEIAQASLEAEVERQTRLRDEITGRILEEIPGSKLNGHPTRRLPNNVNVSFDGVSGRSLLFELDFDGICVSTGSACSSKDSKPSHVLTAIHLTSEQARGSLRVTIGKFTTEADVEYLLGCLAPAVEKLRKESGK